MARDYMGRGIDLPFRADTETGDLARASDERNVRNSVIMFLRTVQGELDLAEGYGLPLVLFENLEVGATDALEAAIRRGLARYEPRITVRSIIVQPRLSRGGMTGVAVTVRYVIRATGTPDSAVYVKET